MTEPIGCPRVSRAGRGVPALGIDPGVTGGAVLLAADGCTLLGGWGWHRLGRAKKRSGRYAWRLDRVHGLTTTHEVPTLGQVGEIIAQELPRPVGYVMAVEGLFGRGPSLVVLAEAAGAVYGPCEAGAVNDLRGYRPRSREWRRALLGISERATGAAGAEAEAVRRVGGWCPGLDGIQSGHVAEAAYIARWAWARHEEEGR